MSKLKMLKFEAATLQANGKVLVEQLQRLGVTELEKIDDKRLFEANVSDSSGVFEKSVDTVSSAMAVLGSYGVNFGAGMFSGRKAVFAKEFDKACEKADETLEISGEIIKLDKRISDLSGEIIRCKTSLDTLSVWEKLDIPTSGVKTESSVVFAGSLSGEHTYDSLVALISESLPDVNEYCIEIVYSSKLITCIVVVCHKSVEKDIYSLLRSVSFTPPPEVEEGGVAEKIEVLKARISRCETDISDIKEKIKSYGERAEDFKFAYDYFTVKTDECKALSDMKLSDSTLYLRGYVPEMCASKLSKVISKNDGAVIFNSPTEEDDVPVLLSNGAFSSPVESIVEMYSMPGKKDIDPSKLMAFFYYLLFGMMLSDAGYGLVLFLGSLAILKFTTVEGGMRRMLKMFVYCGISTVFWGALFGSWFGDAIPLVAREFFGKEIGTVALWFDPLTDPITLLLFSFCIGIVHLFLGLGAFGYMKWKAGDKVGAICYTIPVMMTVAGAAPLAAGVLVSVPVAITGVAKYVAIVGVVLVILTTARSGNILLRLGGGLYGLYNMASGYLSDILSYSRLLALGLATGCIGSVVNMLAVMVKTPGISVVVFILVFIVGHSLNMAINVLGAYVHTNRLQFVELFSKFYEGGGRAFEPLKLNTKYYKISEENEND